MASAARALMAARARQGPLDRRRGQQVPVRAIPFTQRVHWRFFLLETTRKTASPDQLLRSAGKSSGADVDAANMAQRRCRLRRALGGGHRSKAPAQNGVTLPPPRPIGQPPRTAQKRPKHNWITTVRLDGLAPHLICRDCTSAPPCGVGSPACAAEAQWSSHPVDPSRLVPLGCCPRGLRRAALVGLIWVWRPFAVSGAGCVANDLWTGAHRPFGGRTKDRPLAMGSVGECGQVAPPFCSYAACCWPCLVVGLLPEKGGVACPAAGPGGPCRGAALSLCQTLVGFPPVCWLAFLAGVSRC